MIQKNCTTIIAGKNTTYDGSVLIGHNEDLDGKSDQQYTYFKKCTDCVAENTWFGAKIPAIKTTLSYTATRVFDKSYIPGDITTGINEYQVAVVNNISYQKDAIVPWPESGRIIWTEYIQTVLERAKTAREAVLILGNLAQTNKHWGPGTIFGVADPEEGWWVEISQDGQWAAKKVPDNEIEFRANIYRIGEIDFKDSETFLFSNDVVNSAVEKGWYQPGSRPFHFAEVYSDKEKFKSTDNTRRHLVLDRLIEEYKPVLKINDLMSILRNHYEDTEFDLTANYKECSPHQTEERTICHNTTELSVILQLRNWLPAIIGGLSWRALGPPCTGVFIPWYTGSITIPEIYSYNQEKESETAYKVFRDLFNRVDNNYSEHIQKIQSIWSNFEDIVLNLQELIEDTAHELYKEDRTLAKEYLSKYTGVLSNLAITKARNLQQELN